MERRMLLPAAVVAAPTMPGVYMARLRASGSIVYVGMAGERGGQGLRGRLRAYLSGKALVSGLGEAALDRALADDAWLRHGSTRCELRRLDGRSSGVRLPWTTPTEFSWCSTGDRAAAVAGKLALVSEHRLTVWNK